MDKKIKRKIFTKKLLHGLLRLCVYGTLLLAGEIFFYTLTKVGRQIPVIKYLFTFNWQVDDSLGLNHIWDLPIYTFYGQASLYMFLVYGLICVAGLEPAYRWMKKHDFYFWFRALVYMFIILAMEAGLGWILYWATGLKIWYYNDWGSWPVFTSFAIAPMWYILGLITEFVINFFDTFENMKLTLYGLGLSAGEKVKNGNKVAVISDVHISFRDSPNGSGWFSGKYPGMLTIILNKIATDKNINRLVINGDFFDTWLCPANRKPFNNAGEIIELWKNAPFMPALKNCIELCDEVWYIPGNHDMGITQDDLNKIVSDSGKTIILKDPATFEQSQLFNSPNGNCKIRFEHGNAADLFNAPVSDTDNDTIGKFPFGYFVTRLANQTSFNKVDKIYKQVIKEVTKSADYKNLFKSTETQNQVLSNDKDQKLGKFVIETFVNVLVAKANLSLSDDEKLTDSSQIIMPEGYDNVTIGELKTKYHSLIYKFFNYFKENASPDDCDAFHKYYLIAVGKNGLNKYARERFGKKDIKLWFKRLFTKPKAEKIVIMSHTHVSKKDNFTKNKICGKYINTGSICNCGTEKAPTWVELIDSKHHGMLVRINKL